MKTIALLLFFLLISELAFCQGDSIIAFYEDTIPKVKVFSDGTRKSYYKSGELMSWSVRNRDSCMSLQVPYQIDYYRSGNRSTEYFLLPNGFVALVGYEDFKNSRKTVGRMFHNESRFNYVNNKLVEIKSERRRIPIEAPYMPSADPNNPTPRKTTYVFEDEYAPVLDENPYRMKRTVRGSCSAKGRFEYFELQDGFIYYYNEKGERELTEKVMNGEIQYNPKVLFQQKELERIIIAYYDRNFNGYAEAREVSKVEWFKLDLNDTTLAKFKWDEIFLFPNLEKLIVNDRIYEMYNYSNETELGNAVINKQGKLIDSGATLRNISSANTSLDSKYVEFPDSSATFTGGQSALQKWLRSNLSYPEKSKNMEVQGTVYLEFLVMANGSIANVEIVKGLDSHIDNEAKRIGQIMPNWKPAVHNGKNVTSKMRLPIQFKLD